MASLVSSADTKSTCNVGDLGSFNPWVGKIPWRKERLLTPVFWPGEFHGLYSHKELDTTERLSLSYYSLTTLFVEITELGMGEILHLEQWKEPYL